MAALRLAPAVATPAALGAQLRRRAAHRPAAARRAAVAVLGLMPGSDSDRVRTAYNNKYNKAKIANDTAAMARIENAYNKILMSALSSRLTGGAGAGGGAGPDVRFADKIDPIPWRPRYAPVADKRELAINGAIAGVGLAWALLIEYSKFTPMVVASLAFVIRLNAKLSALNPSSADKEKAKAQDGKRLLRCAGLVLGALALGIWGTAVIPTTLSQALRFPLPFFYFQKANEIINAVAILLMFVSATFFR